MFEDDDEEEEEESFFQRRLHPLQIVFVGIVDKLVDLTSDTYFAKILQVNNNNNISPKFNHQHNHDHYCKTSELYWDTTAGINQMDANCRFFTFKRKSIIIRIKVGVGVYKKEEGIGGIVSHKTILLLNNSL